ncbi:MAG: hypothetical protein OXI49_14585 [Acidobacteriota bacterium]|nr:hypothetical protein [Acidobacteriota bacterium]
MTATVVPFHSSPESAFTPERVPAPEPETCVVDTAEDFGTLRDRARDLVAKGSYKGAGTVYLQAMEVATADGESDLAEEALCGWGAAETELGNGTEVMPELRRILLGSAVDHNCCLAAYTLARAHELEGEVKKALFYARLFRDRAEYVERAGLRGLAQNLMGNLLVAEGREADAAACYRVALRLSEGAAPSWTASAEGNLGYCLVVQAAGSRTPHRARFREGLKLLYRSLRTFRRERAEWDIALSHLDLCFAHLELRRTACAKRHAATALKLAKRVDDLDLVKNCLYLLGQAAILEGDTEAARASFSDLERRFYPERTGLTDVLMSVDLRQVVNLRA